MAWVLLPLLGAQRRSVEVLEYLWAVLGYLSEVPEYPLAVLVLQYQQGWLSVHRLRWVQAYSSVAAYGKAEPLLLSG